MRRVVRFAGILLVLVSLAWSGSVAAAERSDSADVNHGDQARGDMRRLPPVDGDVEPALFRVAVDHPGQVAATLPSIQQVAFQAPSDRLVQSDPPTSSGQYLNRPPSRTIMAPESNRHGVSASLGGYVKADFIHDFNPIDSTDEFDVSSIPVGAPDRTNSRFHAKQTRINLDVHWPSPRGEVRVFVEGDFFGDGDTFRLRHAYGRSEHLLVGQSWTTFTDSGAVPLTLDIEGSVASVRRRQAQARWTVQLPIDGLSWSTSMENPSEIIDLGDDQITPRTPSPDFITRLRYESDLIECQAAALYRRLGVQGDTGPVITESAGGTNFTCVLRPSERDYFYSQVIVGTGIGSYRGLPDVAFQIDNTPAILDFFGWMVGLKHRWTDQWSSNVTYAQSRQDAGLPLQPEDLSEITYLAVNLIYHPVEHMGFGIEYLYGERVNADGASGEANRVQFAFMLFLP